MSLFVPIRNYCERTADTLWGEPINAISNIAFFMAAFTLWRLYQSHNAKNPTALVLITLIALIGTGSTLFHIFANTLTMLADIIPIALFTLCYLWFALRYLLALNTSASLMWIALFCVVSTQLDSLPTDYQFNGSIIYLPCLLALSVIGTVLLSRQPVIGRSILMASACFLFSLIFRSIDYHICPHFSVGTHFIWHSLNGLLLYLLARVFIPFPSTATSPH